MADSERTGHGPSIGIFSPMHQHRSHRVWAGHALEVLQDQHDSQGVTTKVV